MTDKPENNKPATDTNSGTIVGEGMHALRRWSGVRRALKKTGYRIFRLAGELTAIVMGLGFLWCYTVSSLLAQKSLDLSAFEPNVAMWFTQAFEGRSAEIGEMVLRWHPADNSLTFDMSDIVVKDKYRVQRNNIKKLRSVFDFDEALRGRVKVQQVDVTGGAVTWKRGLDGQVTMGVGTPETVGQFATVPSGSSDGNDLEIRQSRKPFSIGELRSVTVTDASVYIVDGLNGVDLQFQETDLELRRQNGQFLLEGSASIPHGGDTSQIEGRALFSPDYEDFDLTVSAANLNPSWVAPKEGQMAQANRLNAPIDMTLQIKSGRVVGLIKADLDLEIGPGEISAGNAPMAIEGVNVKASYDPEAQILNFSNLDIRSEKHALAGTAQMTNIGRPAIGFFKAPVGFEVDVSDVRLDLTQMFDAPFKLGHVKVAGGFDRRNNALVLNSLNAEFPNFAINTRLELERDQTGELKRVAGKGLVVGEMSPQQLLGLWPTEFAGGARRWIDRAILAGSLDNINFDFSLGESALGRQPIAHDDLTLSFDLRGGEVRYISTMTSFTNVSASGVLHGNSFEIEATSGQVGGLEVKRAYVEIPQLNPKGGDLSIDVKGQGSVSEMLTLIDQKPFGFASKYGIDPESFTGIGDIDLTITRPLLENFDQSRVHYGVEGQFTNVKVPFSLGTYQLKDGNLSMSADKTGINVNGPVNLGPWAANLIWEQPFSENPGPTSYKLSGLMDRQTLDGFGVGLRKYFDGQFQVDVVAAGEGLAIAEAQLKADLTDAELRIADYWSKESGVAAQLSAVLKRSDQDIFSAENVKVDAPGLSAQGKVAFAQDMRLLEFELAQAKVDGFIDGQVKIAPSFDLTAFDVSAGGAFFDVSPFVAQALAAPSQSGISIPMNLKASFDRLALHEAFVLRDADLEVIHNGMGTESGLIQGKTAKGDFLAKISKSDDQNGRDLTIDIPDASQAMTSFVKIKSLKGGRLQLNAKIPKTGAEGPMQGLLEVEDFRLVNAPVFAQLLSLASLKGLADAMGGAGLVFDELELPFAYEKGGFSVRDGRASGPALGLTGSGEVDIWERVIDVDGVLVPAYTANSALASIPVLGGIFVGKKGEGIFALNYSVKGPFKSTQVAVNPLSALTPGFLRRIFDSDREALPNTQADKTDQKVPDIPDE